MRKDSRNWLDSAEYDLETARYMLSSKRYLYVVFLCHLALEKALKAVVSEVTQEFAPRTHDLVFLIRRAGLTPEPQHLQLMSRLNDARIGTRYPEDIRQAVKEYDRTLADTYLRETEEVLAWIKASPILAE